MIEGENKFDLNNFLNKEDLNFIADENNPSWIEAHTEEHKIDLEQDQDDLPKINATLRLGGKARQDRYYLTATIYRDKDILCRMSRFGEKVVVLSSIQGQNLTLKRYQITSVMLLN